MEACGTCKWLDYEEDGLFCPVLDKRVWQVNTAHRDPLCSNKKMEKYIKGRALVVSSGIVEEVKKVKGLRKIHILLGAEYGLAHDYKELKEKRIRGIRGKRSVYRDKYGEHKSRRSMDAGLRELFRKAVKEVHPDANPFSHDATLNEKTAILVGYYNRGKEIIERHFKYWR